ncbi:acyl-CoA dehydrogenase family protein [Plantactinospora sp. B5E13]|uniref:acyl-CoA dehydrogenase family protein n=1 Tax=unclassified Plantactinospora TaxID=2631981 RepID=UPI00325F65F5
MSAINLRHDTPGSRDGTSSRDRRRGPDSRHAGGPDHHAAGGPDPDVSRAGAVDRHHAGMERLERALGDPRDPAGIFSYAGAVALDERGGFPDRACRRLDELGLPRSYVPAALGGDQADSEQLLQVIRVLSRRDLTLTIAHCKTYLGAVSVWLAGTPEQARRLAGEVSRGAVVSFALTERAHGSDLLAGDVSATPGDDGGYRVDGEKWLINNATRARWICLLARTDPKGGARGFSLLLVDKEALPAGAYRCLPDALTHGVRGANISGIGFHDARVPADAVVGPPGTGLEIALKSFQITRTLCAGMSLGLADRALRIATDFAVAHRLYGRALVDLPHAGRTLAEAYADGFVAEAVALVSTRGIQALPGELSVASAVVKYLVPTRTDRTVAELGQVLGARAMLTEGFADGGFQKTQRDHRIVGIFDGNTTVNLNALINQLPQLARRYATGTVDPGLVAAATLDAALPTLEPSRLALTSRTGCSLVQGLPALLDEMAADAGLPDGLLGQLTQVRGMVDELHARIGAYRPAARQVPAEAFDLAQRYATCYAVAACLRLWWHNRSSIGGPTAGLWADALWLRAALSRLLDDLAPDLDRQFADGELYDRLLPWLRAQHRDHRLFSVLPCRLGEQTGAGPGEGTP